MQVFCIGALVLVEEQKLLRAAIDKIRVQFLAAFRGALHRRVRVDLHDHRHTPLVDPLP